METAEAARIVGERETQERIMMEQKREGEVRGDRRARGNLWWSRDRRRPPGRRGECELSSGWDFLHFQLV